MLKLRNIIIIFLGLLICISTICMIMEANLITNAARTATTYTQIAAECALKSATMTDEFFTSGVSKNGNYANGVSKVQGNIAIRNTAGSSGLLIDLDNNGTFADGFSRDTWDTNIYALTFGITNHSNARVFAETAYTEMFGTDEFKAWSGAILAKSASQRAGSKGLYSLCTRPILWFDTFEHTTSTTANWEQGTGIIYVPKLLTMGTELFVNNGVDADELFNTVKNTNVFIKRVGTKGFFGDQWGSASNRYESLWYQDNVGASSEEKLQALLDNADYWNYRRQTTITLDNAIFGDIGSYPMDIDYYYTPTSLGMTYIDPDMLNILFRSNLDLLMRCSYLQGDGSLAGYNSKIPAGYYDELDAILEDGQWADCAVNNGQFYYFRGQPELRSNKLSYYDLAGTECIKPEIEYYYIPICDGSPNSGSKLTQNTIDTLDKNSALRNVIYRALDAAESPSRLIGEQNTGGDTRTYELVVAKVTFYADFVYPYKTSTLRGMAHWWGDDSTSGTHIAENDSLTMGITQTRLNSLVGTPYTTEESVVDGGTQYKYTTYYAIAV